MKKSAKRADRQATAESVQEQPDDTLSGTVSIYGRLNDGDIGPLERRRLKDAQLARHEQGFRH
jgi:hypothetical protein